MCKESRSSPVLRRAIMRVRPEYFGWSQNEREHYAVHCPDDDDFRIDSILLKELFGIAPTSREETKAAFDELNETQLNLFNETVLPFTGVGEDNFFLNEFFGEDKSILNFETVYDYDHADHEFQEGVRQKETPSYVARPYRGVLYLGWARLFLDEVFTYANLSMVAGYLYARTDEVASEIMGGLIPHQYVHGKNHGMRSGNGFEWDMRVDAGGKEGLLDELRHLQNDYLMKRHEVLSETWDGNALKAFYIGEPALRGELNRDFLFSDKTALRAVRFRSFMQDCRVIERPFNGLTPYCDAEKQAVENFLRTEHERLSKNFDPKVVTLRKKRKIIVHEAAAEKLLF